MEGMSTLKVAHQLNATVNQLYEQTIARLEGAFASVCNDFRQNQYMKVRPNITDLLSYKCVCDLHGRCRINRSGGDQGMIKIPVKHTGAV